MRTVEQNTIKHRLAQLLDKLISGKELTPSEQHEYDRLADRWDELTAPTRPEFPPFY